MTLIISSHPCSIIRQFKDSDLHAKAQPPQTALMHFKRQVVAAVGPLSTGGVLLRPINSMVTIRMEKNFNETIFIISSYQVTSDPGLVKKKIQSRQDKMIYLTQLNFT